MTSLTPACLMRQFSMNMLLDWATRAWHHAKLQTGICRHVGHQPVLRKDVGLSNAPDKLLVSIRLPQNFRIGSAAKPSLATGRAAEICSFAQKGLPYLAVAHHGKGCDIADRTSRVHTHACPEVLAPSWM